MSMLQSERGASAIEFALVLPLLLVITFGIIEFGIILFDKAVITNASREGARLGVVYDTDGTGAYDPKSDAEICTAVINYTNNRLINLGAAKKTLTCNTADIQISPSTRSSGLDLTVTVNFTYTFLVFPNLEKLIGGSFNATMPLSATTIMRME